MLGICPDFKLGFPIPPAELGGRVRLICWQIFIFVFFFFALESQNFCFLRTRRVQILATPVCQAGMVIQMEQGKNRGLLVQALVANFICGTRSASITSASQRCGHCANTKQPRTHNLSAFVIYGKPNNTRLLKGPVIPLSYQSLRSCFTQKTTFLLSASSS